MEKDLKTDLWMEYWNLYDNACWRDYLSRPETINEFKNSETHFESYLHDGILVPAIEQIEDNLEQIEGTSKFLYWFRFREEFLIVTEDYKLPNIQDFDKDIRLKYEEYITRIDQVSKLYGQQPKPGYEYFKWFYISLCSLKGDANIFFNEMLFNLPLFNQSEINKRNLELLEEAKREKTVNIYNYGSIDTLINNLENVSFPKDNEIKTKENIEIVEIIIENFKRQIEANGLFKLLYEGNQRKLRHENSAQQLFFSVAQIFCLANDLDVSPETNSGLGCVDFKFSKGSIGKINVEIKYSNHLRLKHGLLNQLKKYDQAEQASASYFLIIKVDDNDTILEEIQTLDLTFNHNKGKVKIVDGRYKNSASVKD